MNKFVQTSSKSWISEFLTISSVVKFQQIGILSKLPKLIIYANGIIKCSSNQATFVLIFCCHQTPVQSLTFELIANIEKNDSILRQMEKIGNQKQTVPCT